MCCTTKRSTYHETIDDLGLREAETLPVAEGALHVGHESEWSCPFNEGLVSHQLTVGFGLGEAEATPDAGRTVHVGHKPVMLSSTNEVLESLCFDGDSSTDLKKLSKCLLIAHLNVRSICPKMSEIRMLCSKYKWSIFGCSETWLDDSVTDTELEIANYNLIRRDRNRKGGGVCVYVRSELSFNVINDLDNDLIEAVWIDILFPKCKPILIGSLYRPPDQSDFYKLLEEVLNNGVKRHGSEVIICGDLNTDTLKKDSVMYKHFKSFTDVFALRQMIVEPTRITPTSQSVIDHILVSDPGKVLSSGVIDCCISDHCLVYLCRKTQKKVCNGHNTVLIRSMKSIVPMCSVMPLRKLIGLVY